MNAGKSWMSDRERRFRELVRDNRGRLRRIARAYAGGAEEERDLYQEMLLEAWRSLSSFEGQSSPDTWLYRVALNTALDHDRSEERRRSARLDDDHPLRDRGFRRPDRRYEQQERLDRLYGAIERLDDADRALVLMYLEETSYREMAEVLGISENYVGVKLHRIRQELSAMLAGEDA